MGAKMTISLELVAVNGGRGSSFAQGEYSDVNRLQDETNCKDVYFFVTRMPWGCANSPDQAEADLLQKWALIAL
jgi:hypothetical protein